MKYTMTRKLENEKVQASLQDGNVDNSDMRTMMFDIFSSRKKFIFNLKQRLNLYFGYIGHFLKCLRCRCLNYDLMLHNIKVYKIAVRKIENECDIINVLQSVRRG